MDLELLARRLASLHAPGIPVEEEGKDFSSPADARAAVAILLRSESRGPEVLLMQRAVRENDRWSGQISLPGGRADAGDADLLATAVREAREEVGLDLARVARLLGRLSPVQAKARGRLLPIWITPFVFAASEPIVTNPGPEATATFWFPLARAHAGELSWTHRYLREGEERALPAWRDEERVVWGLTYEILMRLFRAWNG